MTVTSSQSIDDNRRKARAEAAAWVVRLHGPHRTPALEAALRDWLSADQLNRREFERITEVWEDARGVPVGGMPRIAYRNRPTRPWAMAAVGLVLVCAVGALTAYGVWFANDYQTSVGEQRIVRLDDGTRVSLNSETRVELRMTRNRRHVTLTRGEAYFEVAHNPKRPFVVSVGNHDVTALGTTFLVRFEPDGTAVTLVEGKVTVSNVVLPPPAAPQEPSAPSSAGVSDGATALPRSSSDTSTDSQTKDENVAGFLSKWSAKQAGEDGARSAHLVTLTPGERLELIQDSRPILDSPHIDAITAWRRGEVVLENTSLVDAIAEMNRYQDEKIVLKSSNIGQLHISGIYRVGDSAGFAETVAKLLHLQVTEEGNEIRLMRGAPADNETRP